MVLAIFLGSSQAIQLSGDPSEKDLMAAIGAALDDAGADDLAGAGGGEVTAALDAADKAGELPSADGDKKDTTGAKPDMVEPPAVALEDDNGNKKSEVEILMEKADHEEAESKQLKSDSYKKQQKKKKYAAIAKQQSEVSELEETLGQVEASK